MRFGDMLTAIRSIVPRRLGSTSANVALIVALLAAGGVATYISQRGRHDASDPLAEARQRPDVQSIPGFSEFTNGTMDIVCNQLSRQANWTHEDAEYLCNLASLRYPASVHNRSTRTNEEAEQHMLYCMVMSSIADRFRIQAPMDDGARALLKKMLLDELTNPLWSVRLNAITCAVTAGFAAEPDTRQRIERMKSDPNPDVAANAAGQLEHMDRIAAAKLHANASKAGR